MQKQLPKHRVPWPPLQAPLLPLPGSARPSWARGEADPHRWGQSAWPPPPTPPQAVPQGVQQLHPQGLSENRPAQVNAAAERHGLLLGAVAVHSKRRGRAECTSHDPARHRPGWRTNGEAACGQNRCIGCRLNLKVPTAGGPAESGPEAHSSKTHRSDMQASINAHPVGAKLELLKPTSEKSSIALRPLIHS